MSVLTWLGVPGTPEKWTECGFLVSNGHLFIDGVDFQIGAEPSWGFDDLTDDASRLGVPTRARDVPGASPTAHPNGVDGIDHIVYAVPNLDAATAAIEDVLGLTLRRRFRPRGPEGPEMAFYRAGPAVIEVVAGPPAPGLWGIALRCPDLDATVAAIRAAGGPVGDPQPAVQGGRIASVWKEHIGWGLAIMEPPRR